MDISIFAVGKLKPGPETDLCARYLDRARSAGKSLGFRRFEVREFPEARAARPAERMDLEAAQIATALPAGVRVVSLDEGGELLDSAGFARFLERCLGQGLPQVFVIGGADGLGRQIRERADRTLSFGRFTWPHQLVRIMLSEQLYRAMTILSGHPYHRA